MVFLVFHDWVVRPVSARVKRDAWVYVLSFRNSKACKIGCTRRTPRRRLQEWRCKDKSKGFKLVYSVQVSEERMFGIEHEAHQQVLKYTHKSNGACPNCSSKHREEFVFKAAFGLRDACDAVDMAKELSVTNQFTTVMAVVSNYSLALDIKPKIAWTENQEKPSATLLDPLVLTTRSITDKYRGLPILLDKICNEEEAEELGIEESIYFTGTLFTSPVENEEKEAAKDDASVDIDTRHHKQARTSVSIAKISIKRDSSKLSKHLSVSSSSSSTRHPSPALSATSSTSHTRERHPSRPLERSRSRSLSVTLAEEEHQKAVEAKERQHQRADSVGIGGVKKRVLSREVSMTRVFKPKARSQTTMVTVEKTVKPVVKTEPKDLVVTLVEATLEKPRIVPGRTLNLSQSQLQQAVPPLPLLILLPHSSSSLQPGSQQTGQSCTRSKNPGPGGLNLSELSEPEGDVDEVGNSDAEVEAEEVWYPPASSSPDVLLLSDKLKVLTSKIFHRLDLILVMKAMTMTGRP
ncbi:hypothetical protein D9758_017097 [Tetrapyrgos nigripes]|uniref:Bacteriophage T5 Orf172 DNA-binding domain-containing protein n=1 Tax=Tetrapyrgos nigripes TaxID=182062 RepID=A0A8H5FEX0_9AGAR|nr:hypothetical protein D9758_017097 [Tetrapyrgos nigripes]